MSQTYRVVWEIDIDADTPAEAAARALIVQRDVSSTAVVFKVVSEVDHTEVTVDLSPEYYHDEPEEQTPI
jgi:hypothetical protein